ncbi:hypothetical protein [Bacteroides sp. 1001136B_160425_E2]|uniref:hypothetical protein n=1 Tax=Bacteroides sp. 1001136B_160425_E2 TaxID=2787083 RepID=UPI00189D3364|nr:hypothetical protein [Bacteroides sp. 1001136B_160425_E2]
MKNKKEAKMITGCLLVVCLFTACMEENGGPSIDDHFLNFEIPEISVSQDYMVGAFYLKSTDRMNGNPGSVNRTDCWARLTGTGDFANYEYDVSPKETPMYGDFHLKTNDVSKEDVDMIQQQMDSYAANGIDFLIMPPINMDFKNGNQISDNDVSLVKLLTGRIGEGSDTDGENDVDMNPDINHVNFPLGFVCSVNVDNLTKELDLTGIKEDGAKVYGKASQLSNQHLIEDMEILPDCVTTLISGEACTRVQLLQRLFVSVADKFFGDTHYYKVDGKPVVLIENAARLYSKDSRVLYDGIRAYVKEQTGYDVYLIAKSGAAWCPPDRYEYFYLQGGVDAVTSQNMYNGLRYDESYYFYPQAIYLNMQYTREYIAAKYNIDFVPTGAVGYNKFVENGDLQTPIIKKEPVIFRRMCNILKAQTGKKRLVFLHAVNEYKYDSFLDSTVEEGDTYLKIVKEQFKR